VGEDVWVKTHSKNEKKWCLGMIHKIMGPVTYLVSVNSQNIKRHVDDIFHAQKFQFRAEPDNDPSTPEPLPLEPAPSPGQTVAEPKPIIESDQAASPGESPQQKSIGRLKRNIKPVKRYGVDQ